MTGTIKRTTTHYNMRIPIFDAPGWGREIERNFDILDAVVFAATNFSLVKGLWTNSTLYDVGDRVVDEDTNTIWECLVQHTSPATGTFEDARTANPTYWQIVSTIVQNRGVWQPGTTYKYNDFVEFDNKVAVTVVPSYTSGASFDDDVANGKLHVVIDLDPQVSAASASASAAAVSASAAQTSEINAANSAGAAAISESNAASSASAANTSAGNASASASSASSSASAAAGSAIAAAASAVDASNAKSAAEGYATDAMDAADAAEATYISFDKRYLGEKSSDPATDNQGQPLAVGALYWNTSFGRMMVFDGVTWKYAAVDADSRFVRFDGAQGLTASQQSQARANIGADVLGGFRNLIINGNFDVWQRGTSQTSSGYGSADRWAVDGTAPSGAFLVSRQGFDLGQTDVPGNPRFFLRMSGSGYSSLVLSLIHKIEGVRTLAGRKATLTFYARASSSRQIRPLLAQFFGSGGSPSTEVHTNGAPVDLTTSWQRFSQVFDVPSIAGKTLGTGGNDFLGVVFDIKRGSFGTDLGDDDIDIARISLVPGDATAEDDPFSPRHIQQELALCQRYYLEIDFVETTNADVDNQSVSCLPVTMRTVPSITNSGTGTFAPIGLTAFRQGGGASSFGATRLKFDAEL